MRLGQTLPHVRHNFSPPAFFPIAGKSGFESSGYLTKALIALVLLVMSTSLCYAATFTSNVNIGNWSAMGTWSVVGFGADGVPDADDDVIIAVGHTITIDIVAACQSLNFNTGAGSSNLNHNAGISLTVGGNVTINPPTMNGNTIACNINAGSAIVNGNITLIEGSTDTRVSQITIATGSLDINGDLTFTVTSDTMVVLDQSGGAGSVTLSGDFNAGRGTLSGGASSLFTYDGTLDQIVGGGGGAFNYNDLTVNKTSGKATLGAVDITISGLLSIQSELEFTTTVGNKNFNDITLNGTGIWDNGVTDEDFDITGSITNNGTWTGCDGTVNCVYQLTGAAETINGTGPIDMPDPVISGTYTNNADYTVVGFSGGGSFTNGATGIFNFGGTTITVTTFTASAVGNTVNYNRSGAQVIRDPTASTYHHLTFSGTNRKLLQAAATVNGNIAVQGSAFFNCREFQITGNATGTLTLASGTGLILGRAGVATNVLFPTNYTAANISLNSASTVTYNANSADQTVSSTPTYGNIGFNSNAATTKTPDGTPLDVAGNMILNGTTVTINVEDRIFNISGDIHGSNGSINMTTGTINIAGSFLIGAITAGTGTIRYNGTGAQTVRGASTAYNNLTIDNPGGTATLQSVASVTNLLTMETNAGIFRYRWPGPYRRWRYNCYRGRFSDWNILSIAPPQPIRNLYHYRRNNNP